MNEGLEHRTFQVDTTCDGSDLDTRGLAAQFNRGYRKFQLAHPEAPGETMTPKERQLAEIAELKARKRKRKQS